MDPLAIIFAIALLAALALCAWLLLGRARLIADARAANSARDETIRRAEEAERRLAEQAARLEAADDRADEAVTEARVQQERLTQIEQRHREALESLTREYEQKLHAEKRSIAEYRADFDKRIAAMRQEFTQSINEAASAAMKQSSEHLLKLTETKLKDATDRATLEHEARSKAVESLVAPIAETLRKTDAKLNELEKDRAASGARLSEQLQAVVAGSEQVRREAANLTQALRKPQVRGRYGEIQLRRVVELAGMRDWCDFAEQENTVDGEGNPLRPDLIVNLPNGRTLVIDAKTNVEAYLDAIDATNPEDESRHLERFARHVSDQAGALSKKGYWERFDGSPDFVVMFIPGDQFIDAALQRRPELLDLAAQQNVILASPSTLIGLLRAVYIGWREQQVAARADELIKLGRELHERTAIVLGHAAALGKSLNTAIEKYNDFQASMDRRIRPTLDRFEELGAKSAKELPEPPLIETRARLPEATAPASSEL